MIVKYIERQMGISLSLSQKELSLKLTMLLVLANACKALDLVAFDVKFVQIAADKVIFQNPRVSEDNEIRASKVVYHCENKSLCPVKALE